MATDLKIGEYVRGGTTAEDRDYGKVIEVKGETVTVAWLGSQVATPADARALQRTTRERAMAWAES